MPDWPAILDELRLIRASMDKIAALVAGEQTKAELMPVYQCGHRHRSRVEAVACGRDSLTPPNADAGAFG